TNRIPRQLLTHCMGWFSQIEQPLVRDLSLKAWRYWADLDLSEAKKSHFTSMHDCFIRELKAGARPVDADPTVMVSPCDAIVGASGRVEGAELIQAKGFPYTLLDLLHDPTLVDLYRDGCYVTLRITDERALIRTRLDTTGHLITLVPVAAVLVASIRLHFLDVLLHLKYRGPHVMRCDAQLQKGEEMGWFQHGSTIIVFAPQGFTLCDNVQQGGIIRMGQPLLWLP
ncbi:MAG: phosphatidylserine decarboxylase, partial [Halothiobacillaceae bacterium]